MAGGLEPQAFLLRGAAALGTVSGMSLRRAALARADVAARQLSPAELAVVGALVSGILGAVGGSGDGSDVGLSPPAEFQLEFAGLDPVTQAQIAATLDAIDALPPHGSFASLSPARLQRFIPRTLAVFVVRGPETEAVVNMQAVEQDLSAFEAALLAGSAAAPVIGDDSLYAEPEASVPVGPIRSAVTPVAPALAAALTLVSGLMLVATPIVVAPPAPALPPGLLASLPAALLGSLSPGELDDLVNQLSASLSSDDSQAVPAEAVVLDQAFAVWVPGS